jgi:hypothetical protein
MCIIKLKQHISLECILLAKPHANHSMIDIGTEVVVKLVSQETNHTLNSPLRVVAGGTTSKDCLGKV